MFPHCCNHTDFPSQQKKNTLFYDKKKKLKICICAEKTSLHEMEGTFFFGVCGTIIMFSSVKLERMMDRVVLRVAVGLFRDAQTGFVVRVILWGRSLLAPLRLRQIQRRWLVPSSSSLAPFHSLLFDLRVSVFTATVLEPMADILRRHRHRRPRLTRLVLMEKKVTRRKHGLLLLTSLVPVWGTWESWLA